MEEDVPSIPSSSSSTSSSTLSETERRQRNRQSEALRNSAMAASSNVLFHSAMMRHGEMGNETAKKIHKDLMDDPNSLDDLYSKLDQLKAQEPIRKLTPLQVYLGFFALLSFYIILHFK